MRAEVSSTRNEAFDPSAWRPRARFGVRLARAGDVTKHLHEVGMPIGLCSPSSAGHYFAAFTPLAGSPRTASQAISWRIRFTFSVLLPSPPSLSRSGAGRPAGERP